MKNAKELREIAEEVLRKNEEAEVNNAKSWVDDFVNQAVTAAAQCGRFDCVMQIPAAKVSVKHAIAYIEENGFYVERGDSITIRISW